MNEADVRGKLSRAARLSGLWPISQTDASVCPTCRNLVRPPIGRPDTLLLNPKGKTEVVEVKVMHPKETSFQFAHIEEKQRLWLDRWEADGGTGYLALGAIRAHGSRHGLDHLWLIEWGKWKEIEARIAPIQSSIPLFAGKGYKKILQEKHLDLVTLCKQYEMYKEDGEWKWNNREH